MSFTFLNKSRSPWLTSDLTIIGLTTAGYILFYTGYSKKTKSLQVRDQASIATAKASVILSSFFVCILCLTPLVCAPLPLSFLQQLKQNLLDVFLVRKSLDHTLVELNKALSLSGLTTLLISCIPTACLPALTETSRSEVRHSEPSNETI